MSGASVRPISRFIRIMPIGKSFLLWIMVSVLLTVPAAMPLAYRSLYPPSALPRTLTELTELLSENAPSLYVVAVVESKPEYGIYICSQPHSREHLMRLLRNSQCADRWKGVIFCERLKRDFVFEVEEEELQTWGGHGMLIEPLLFFGDPDLLHSIRKAIFDHQGGSTIPEQTTKERDPMSDMPKPSNPGARTGQLGNSCGLTPHGPS